MPFCPRCGKEVERDAAFCSNCGGALTQQPISPPSQQPTYPPTGVESRVRPVGVTILTVLNILGGIIYFALGLIMGAAYYLRALGFICVFLGLISFVFAYGLLKGRGWAWTITYIFSIIGALIDLVGLPLTIVSLAVHVIIIYYLTRPRVRAFFGKANMILFPFF